MSDTRIKNEALKLFAQKGYEGTSVRDIARKVDLTASAIYSHFLSKEKLYLEILNACVQEFIQGVEDTINKYKNEEEERTLYYTYLCFVEFFMKSSPTSIFILRNIIFPPDGLQDIVKATFAEEIKTLNCRIEKILEKCLDAKKVSAADYVNSYFRLIEGFIIDIAARKNIFAIEELDRQWKIYWRLIQEI